jgi:hypothetical protein
LAKAKALVSQAERASEPEKTRLLKEAEELTAQARRIAESAQSLAS